jgi:bifunctional pyridoxal-dependent enzyme with beta-cystathionase and maltose regulon repressor activities
MSYEELLKEADGENLCVREKNLMASDGLIKNNRIAIRKSIDTNAEKTCVLAEELGHHYTSVGDIIDQRIAENQKQELQARMYAYNKLIGLDGLISCYEYGCQNIHEMADYLEVTERFVVDALIAYEQKYGVQKRVGNYLIRFNPNLSVIKIIGI